MTFAIHDLLTELSVDRPIFHSEADFQLAVFRLVSKKMPYQVHLEVWPESHWPGFALRQADVLQVQLA